VQVSAHARGDSDARADTQADMHVVVECRNLPVGVTELEVAALFEDTGGTAEAAAGRQRGGDRADSDDTGVAGGLNQNGGDGDGDRAGGGGLLGLSHVASVQFLPHDATVARVRLRSQRAAAAATDSLEGRFFQGEQLTVRQLSQVPLSPSKP
jgi:hypothetical protein